MPSFHSFVPNCWYSPSYTRPLSSLIVHFAVFFATLYRFMLSALVSRCIRVKYSFFSLIAFCTFSFHYHVSLASRLPPLITPSSFESTFLMQVSIFINMLFASPPSCQGSSLRTLVERPRCLFFKFPPLRPWLFDVLTSLKANLKAKICYHKLMLKHDILSKDHLTI
jgi:hypothetical protein